MFAIPISHEYGSPTLIGVTQSFKPTITGNVVPNAGTATSSDHATSSAVNTAAIRAFAAPAE